MAPRPIPEGYHSVTPYLIVTGAAGAIEFYKHAFGAKEVMRMRASRRPRGPRGTADRRFAHYAGRRVPGDRRAQPDVAGRYAVGFSFMWTTSMP